jgi:2Fe-2S ferredoxin
MLCALGTGLQISSLSIGFEGRTMAVINVTDRAGKSHTLDGKVGNTLMENLRDAGLDVEAICGGCCSCATCHVFIDDAWVAKMPERTIDEFELVEQTRSFKDANSRLSCQIKFTADMDGIKVTVAPAE